MLVSRLGCFDAQGYMTTTVPEPAFLGATFLPEFLEALFFFFLWSCLCFLPAVDSTDHHFPPYASHQAYLTLTQSFEEGRRNVRRSLANQAGPSGSAPKDAKTKRPRKRMRNKKRTTEVEDSSSSSSDSSDDEDDKEAEAAPVQATAKTIPEESKADSDSDSDDDDEQGEKRKRKRKRKAKKETTEKVAASSAPSASVTSTPSTAKPIMLSPEDVGPDPNTDLRLSDQAKQAIHYAQTYTKDKSQWKFNKAKQNWLYATHCRFRRLTTTQHWLGSSPKAVPEDGTAKKPTTAEEEAKTLCPTTLCRW